ncbi:hypothetical protein F0562_013626 [Nyssa sinensis]|uniref:Uncharacterized protein n=1 Tax=Nyssa sinensis TaxID=561372 RepID=A0A5J4ZL72_9ASTE|nr:hypothetical protein F0562_013626 [Nyssa sinensis]
MHEMEQYGMLLEEETEYGMPPDEETDFDDDDEALVCNYDDYEVTNFDFDEYYLLSRFEEKLSCLHPNSSHKLWVLWSPTDHSSCHIEIRGSSRGYGEVSVNSGKKQPGALGGRKIE